MSITHTLAHWYIALGAPDHIAVLGAVFTLFFAPVLAVVGIAGIIERWAR